MCGRFTLRASARVIAEQFDLFEELELRERFNVAPGQPVAVVRMASDTGRRELRMMLWGLIPHWANDPAIGNRLINARSETAAEKPAFRQALAKRRCLLPADGFYEWRREGKTKQPFYFHLRDQQVFAFAGAWEQWEGPDHSLVESCTLFTTEPNELVRPIHDRMPVILPPSAYAAWLDPGAKAADVVPLLRPYPAEAMQTYPVGLAVNRPTHDRPDCIAPADTDAKKPGELF